MIYFNILSALFECQGGGAGGREAIKYGQGWRRSLGKVVVLGFNFDDLLQVGLVEVFASVGEDILRLLFQDFTQKYRNHVLQFGVFAEVELVADPVLHFLAVQQLDLGWGQALHAHYIVLVVVVVPVVEISHLVLVQLLLFFLVCHSIQNIICSFIFNHQSQL